MRTKYRQPSSQYVFGYQKFILMPEDYNATKSGKVNVKLPEVVGKGYGTFWRWKGRYRAVKGSRASKGEIKLGDDGKIKGEDDLITGLKTQHPAMFQVSNGNQQNNRKILENNLPNGDNDKTVTKEQFLKMGFNERMKLKEENPDLFKQLNTH